MRQVPTNDRSALLEPWDALLEEARAARLRSHSHDGLLTTASIERSEAAVLADWFDEEDSPSAASADEYHLRSLRSFGDTAMSLTRESRAVRTSWVVGDSWRQALLALGPWFRLLNATKHLKVTRIVVLPRAFVRDAGIARSFSSQLTRVVCPRARFVLKYVLSEDLPKSARRDVSIFELKSGNRVAQDSVCGTPSATGFCTSNRMLDEIERVLDRVEGAATATSIEELATTRTT